MLERKGHVQTHFREGALIGGGGGGGGVGPAILEFFCVKGRGPSHFPDWINAWPFTNA